MVGLINGDSFELLVVYLFWDWRSVLSFPVCFGYFAEFWFWVVEIVYLVFVCFAALIYEFGFYLCVFIYFNR